MKLLTAGPQPFGLLTAAKPRMTDEEIRAWYEEQIAKMDLKQLLMEAFFPYYVFNSADRTAVVKPFIYKPPTKEAT